jgi:hypothetical protein
VTLAGKPRKAAAPDVPLVAAAADSRLRACDLPGISGRSQGGQPNVPGLAIMDG